MQNCSAFTRCIDCVAHCVWGVYEDGRTACAESLRALGGGLRDYAVSAIDCPEYPSGSVGTECSCVGQVIATFSITALAAIGIGGGIFMWWLYRPRQQELEPQFHPILGFENPNYGRRNEIVLPIPVDEGGAGPAGPNAPREDMVAHLPEEIPMVHLDPNPLPAIGRGAGGGRRRNGRGGQVSGGGGRRPITRFFGSTPAQNTRSRV